MNGETNYHTFQNIENNNQELTVTDHMSRPPLDDEDIFKVRGELINDYDDDDVEASNRLWVSGDQLYSLIGYDTQSDDHLDITESNDDNNDNNINHMNMKDDNANITNSTPSYYFVFKGPQFGDRWWPVIIFTNFLVITWLATPILLDIVIRYDPSIDWIFASMLATAAITGIFGIIILLALSANELIHHLFWVGITVNGLIGLVCLFFGNIKGFIINTIITIVISFYYKQSQKDIPFARAMLATCTSCFRDNSAGLVSIAAVIILLQLSLVTIWAITANRILGILAGAKEDGLYGPNGHDIAGADTDDPRVVIALGLLFTSLILGISAIRAMAETIAAGTVAAWWFCPKSPAPVRGAIYRACTAQLGTICFGSLAIPICCLLYDITQGLKKLLVPVLLIQRGPFVPTRTMLANSLITFAAKVAWHSESLNRYAVCMVAGKNYPLRAAGQAAAHLLKTRGWGALAQDNLVGRVMSFGELLIVVFGILSGLEASRLLTTLLDAENTDDGNINYEWHEGDGMPLSVALMICGGLLGFAVGHTVTCAFSAGVSCVLICLAHDNGSHLKKARSATYHLLAEAWDTAYPGVLPKVSAASSDLIQR